MNTSVSTDYNQELILLQQKKPPSYSVVQMETSQYLREDSSKRSGITSRDHDEDKYKRRSAVDAIKRLITNALQANPRTRRFGLSYRRFTHGNAGSQQQPQADESFINFAHFHNILENKTLYCKMTLLGKSGVFSSLLTSMARNFHTSPASSQVILLTRLRVVDNSPIGKQAMLEGKPPKCIHVYNKTGVGTLGDKVMVAIKGQKKKAVIVGVKQKQPPYVPKFDSNNIVLIDDNGTPLGTRIHVPIPSVLRKVLRERSVAKVVDYTKILSIATRFV
nr:EOG090X0MX9 [Eulimnadia texana]